MNPEYINAIETRLRWLRHAQDFNRGKIGYRMKPDHIRNAHLTAAVPDFVDKEPAIVASIMPNYEAVLASAGPTYFMDKHFCQLVDHARGLTPDSLQFDTAWLHSTSGFLWLEDPFYVPPIQLAHRLYKETGEESWLTGDTLMPAVGWWPVPYGTPVADDSRANADIGCGTIIAGRGDYQFLIFKKNDEDERFYTWSFFILRDGMILGDRVEQYERMNTSAAEGDNYVRRPEDTTLHPLHEIRWVYTALYLMAQRLTSRVRHDTDRHTRRRAERENHTAPPFIEVVTLRQLRHDKAEAERTHAAVDWAWQWHVRGHWRSQYYPAEGIHKPKFIEAYMKGPEEKPVKPPTVKLFAAVR